MNSDMYGLAAAYVLDALDDEERAEFEEFMASSPEVAAEVDSLREAVAMLATGAAETPPAGLKIAVLDAIDQTRQDRPVVSLADARRRADEPDPATREWVTNLSYVAAAIATVIAVGLGVAVANLSSRVDSIQSSGQQIAAVVAAEDSQRVSIDVAEGGTLSAVISPNQGSAIVVGEGLAPLRHDEMYALWAIVDGIPRPAGEFIAGQALTIAAGDLDSIGLTVEPRGPLSTPTGEIQALLSV
ncbi:MAG: anti-sigma factor [Euzebya sp.]